MEDAVSDPVRPSTMKVNLFKLARIKAIKVFMISVHKECREWFVIQPVKPIALFMGLTPYAAKVTADDDKIILRQFLLLRKSPC